MVLRCDTDALQRGDLRAYRIERISPAEMATFHRLFESGLASPHSHIHPNVRRWIKGVLFMFDSFFRKITSQHDVPKADPRAEYVDDLPLAKIGQGSSTQTWPKSGPAPSAPPAALADAAPIADAAPVVLDTIHTAQDAFGGDPDASTEPKNVALAHCPRCGGRHEKITLHKFDRPLDRCTHWGMCPIANDPLLFRIRDRHECE